MTTQQVPRPMTIDQVRSSFATLEGRSAADKRMAASAFVAPGIAAVVVALLKRDGDISRDSLLAGMDDMLPPVLVDQARDAIERALGITE